MAYIPPNANGQATKANSSPVVIASDDDLQAKLGIVTETAPASDTASSGLNGRLQRVAQRLTSLIGLFPTALGSTSAANSFAVTQSTEDVARMGAVNETAPATDTASSGLNGRLQRIAQRLTTLLAVFPTTLDTNSGNKSASTLRMVLATDQPQFTTPINVSQTDLATTAQNLVMTNTANAVTLSSINNGNGATVQITGTWTGTVIFEGSADGTNFFSNPMQSVNGTGALVTTATANGQWQGDIAGFTSFRVRCSVTGSGTAVVTIRNSAGVASVSLDAPIPAGTNIIGALSANQSVNVAQINGVAPSMGSGTNGTGVQRVTLATDQSAVSTAGLFSVKIDQTTVGTTNAVSLAQIGSTTIATGNGTSSAGVQRVALVSDNTAVSTAGLFSVKIDQTTPGTTNAVQPVAGTSGGESYSYAISAASNNKTQAKGSAGQVYSITVENISSAPVYLKMFDKTSANVTAGTTACDYQYMCPANGTAANGAGITITFPNGRTHANGITWMLTTGISNTDNTSTSANIAIVNIGYK